MLGYYATRNGTVYEFSCRATLDRFLALFPEAREGITLLAQVVVLHDGDAEVPA
jgi:hypothetical protein